MPPSTPNQGQLMDQLARLEDKADRSLQGQATIAAQQQATAKSVESISADVCLVADRVGELATSSSVQKAQLDGLSCTVTDLVHAISGNGKPGILTRVALLEEQIKDTEKKRPTNPVAVALATSGFMWFIFQFMPYVISKIGTP